MKKNTPISSSEEFAHFLFEQIGIRWQVSERPILTMHEVTNQYTRQEYTTPVWLWTITIFIPSESGQLIAEHTIVERLRQDNKPDEDTVIGLFEGYAYIAGNIWDRRHYRWYGYDSWRSNNEGDSSCNRTLYQHEKAKVLAVRELLGKQGFCQLICAEL